MLQIVYNRAVEDLDVEEAELEGEEIAAQFPVSFRAAQWRQSCMEIMPKEGVALLAKLRCMMAATGGGPRSDQGTLKRLMECTASSLGVTCASVYVPVA